MTGGKASANYTQGIQNCNVNPMALAATPEAQQRYATGTANAVSSGRMAAKLNATPVTAWKNGAATKGAQNLATGARNASAKTQAAFNSLAGSWQAMRDAANAIQGPKGVQTGIAKVAAALQAQAQALGRT